MQSELSEKLNPILRLMKLREQNYFRLVDFIDKNMQGMSNEAEQLTIVTIFIQQLAAKEETVCLQERSLLGEFVTLTSPSKLVSRLCARVFELLEQSLQKIRNTYFHTTRVEADFNKFKLLVNEKLSNSDRINVGSLAHVLLEYSKSKFQAQQSILERFATKLEAGYHVLLKDLYDRPEPDDDDEDQSPCSKKYPDRKKDGSSKDASRAKGKKGSQAGKKLRSSDNKSESTKLKSSEKSDTRPANMVNKMMKLYSVCDPSKTQFIEDMVYANIDDQKAKLVAALLDKNKSNFQQMKEFREKAEADHVDLEELRLHPPQSFASDPEDHDRGPNTPPGYKSVAFFKGDFVIKSHKLNNFMRKREDQDKIFGSDYSSGAEYMSDGGGMSTGAVWVGQRNDRASSKRHRTLVKSNKTSNNASSASSNNNSLASRNPSTGTGVQNGAKKVFPNLSRAYKLNEYCDQPVISNQSAITTTRTNRVFIVKSPTVVDQQQIRNKLVIGSKAVAVTSRREEKNSPTPIHIQAAPGLTNRSPVRQGQSTLEMERSRLLGEKPRREYNLRMKKQMKKSLVSTQFMQANQHISNYNFPEDR